MYPFHLLLTISPLSNWGGSYKYPQNIFCWRAKDTCIIINSKSQIMLICTLFVQALLVNKIPKNKSKTVVMLCKNVRNNDESKMTKHLCFTPLKCNYKVDFNAIS